MNLKNISKYVAIICAVAVMFTACSKDENLSETSKTGELETIIPVKCQEIELNKTLRKTDRKKSSNDYNFIDGGYVIVPGLNQMFSCVIIGNQRWLTQNINVMPTVGEGASVINPVTNVPNPMYNREEAEYISNTATQGGYTMGQQVVELSDWHIPTWQEAADLYALHGGDDIAEIAGLKINQTGILEQIFDNEPIIDNPTHGVFWCWDKILEQSGDYTYHFFGADVPNNQAYLFHHQYPYWAPVRLMQIIEPIE